MTPSVTKILTGAGLLAVLSAVADNSMDPVPGCGAHLKYAKDKQLVVFDERGNPRLTPAGEEARRTLMH